MHVVEVMGVLRALAARRVCGVVAYVHMGSALAGDCTHQWCPAIEYRQDRIRLRGGQAADHARDAEIAELVQPIEILGDAEQCDRERCGISPRFGRELVELWQRGGYVGRAGAA